MASDLNSLLLERLNGSGEGLPSVQDLVAEMAAADPRMALLARIIAMRRVAAENRQAEEPEDQPVPPEVYNKIVAIRRELDELRGRNDELAAALGACYLCWGTRIDCVHCHGQGGSGSFPVDPGGFDQFVVPAVRRHSSMHAPGISANGGQSNGHGNEGGTA